MKKGGHITRWAAAVVAALIVGGGILAAPGLAQEQEEELLGPMGPPEGPMGPGFGGPRGGFLHWRLMRELNLTKEQEEQIRELRKSHFEETADEREKLVEAREAFQEAVHEGDATRIEQAGAALGMAQAQLAIARQGLRSELREILTPEQQKKLEELGAEAEKFRKERMEHMKKRRQRPPHDGPAYPRR